MAAPGRRKLTDGTVAPVIGAHHGGVGREQQVNAAFVAIADALVAEPHPDLVGIYAGLAADCARILDVTVRGCCT